MGCIYKITNLKNNKCYIGQTSQKDPMKRWRDHLNYMKTGVGGCPLLTNAAKKYGVDSFEFKIVIICFDSDLNKFEKEYIKKYDSILPNGYNILEGGIGGNGFKGKKHSKETRDKLKEYMINKFKDPIALQEHRKSIQKFYDSLGEKTSEKWKEFLEKRQNIKPNASKIRNTKTPEIKEKIRDSVNIFYKNNGIEKSQNWQKALKENRVGQGNKGIKLSETRKKEIRNKMCELYSNKEYVEKRNLYLAKKLGKPICQKDMNKNVIKTYFSTGQAAKECNISRASIQKSLYSGVMTNNYYWEFVI